MAGKGNPPSGVRGPGGPPQRPGRPAQPTRVARPAGPARLRVERASYPALVAMQRIPRWLMIVLPAIFLFGGLVLKDSLAWLGGLLLLVVAAFLGWLLLLSWPALTPLSRFVRAITVLAVIGLAGLKFTNGF